MKIGYASRTLGLPASYHSVTLKNATEENRNSIIRHNLNVLHETLRYNAANGILLFRISSDLVPFASGPIPPIPWQKTFASELQTIGAFIKGNGLRVSMHPGQYTVLSSFNEQTAENARKELQYHADLLDCMGLGSTHKIVLHLGGAYGDKKTTVARFAKRFNHLDASIKNRLTLENDEKLYAIDEVLQAANQCGIPAVFDVLHHTINPPKNSDSDLYDWILRCAETWNEKDGTQKIHYSQQNPSKKTGAHSDTIAVKPFLDFCRALPQKEIDMMLEVKDKDLSALKCIHCLTENGSIAVLEHAWAKYKYTVLEHSAADYQTIRNLLKKKTSYPAVRFYELIEHALQTGVSEDSFRNAAQHVWGYFTQLASPAQKQKFLLLSSRANTRQEQKLLKRFLLRLAQQYNETYLLSSYYFIL
jgi:UV DNA damage endonuclease